MKQPRRPSRSSVALILAIGVSLSLVVVFFFTASPWTPVVDDTNSERMFAALGAVIAALAVWLGGKDGADPPDTDPPAAEDAPKELEGNPGDQGA